MQSITQITHTLGHACGHNYARNVIQSCGSAMPIAGVCCAALRSLHPSHFHAILPSSEYGWQQQVAGTSSAHPHSDWRHPKPSDVRLSHRQQTNGTVGGKDATICQPRPQILSTTAPLRLDTNCLPGPTSCSIKPAQTHTPTHLESHRQAGLCESGAAIQCRVQGDALRGWWQQRSRSSASMA